MDPEALLSLAEYLRARSKYSEAVVTLKKALKSFSIAGNNEGVLLSSLSIADNLRMLGKFRNAIRYYHIAFEISKEMRDRKSQADSITGTGLSLRAMGLWKESLKNFRSSLEIYESTDDI